MNPGPVFFTDRDLGKKFPEILRAAGLRIERHMDHFRHDTPDEEWLWEIGKRKWIALTHDGPPYFPMQKLPKISPSKSSLVNSPVISPKAC
jgi:PIN like domain